MPYYNRDNNFNPIQSKCGFKVGDTVYAKPIRYNGKFDPYCKGQIRSLDGLSSYIFVDFCGEEPYNRGYYCHCRDIITPDAYERLQKAYKGKDIQQMTIDEEPMDVQVQIPHIDKIAIDGEVLKISTDQSFGKTAEALKRVADEVHKNIDYTMKSTGNPYKDYLNRIYGVKSCDQVDALSYAAGAYILNDIRATAELMGNFNKTKKENKNMKQQQKKRDRNIIKAKDGDRRKIREIMFNGPATIIKWDPTWHQYSNDIVGDKTVTVAKEPDKFDKTTGFLLAVLKEVLDNQSYGNVLEKIDEIRLEEECKKVADKTVKEDLKPKCVSKASEFEECHHVPKETIKTLNEAAEAMRNAFHIGSRVKYLHGKQAYRVVDFAYVAEEHEIFYTLSAYRNEVLSGYKTPKVYKVPHHRLKQIKRR